jgi:ribosomal-protein-serine acetyltransferase
VFSITKMFIAVACLRLAGRRTLGLDKDARTWLPAAPAGATVPELLSHTAGLADYPATDAYQAAVAAHPAEPWDLEQILKVSLAESSSEPGHFHYCDVGYWLLGAIIERVTRTPLAELLATEVFGPTEMTETAYPDLRHSITADGYSTLWAGPAGAVWSTAADLDKFLAALLSESLLTASARAAMSQATAIEPHSPWPAPGYGLGLMTDQVLHTIGHGGNGPGYQIAAFTLLSGDRSAVVITAPHTRPDPIHQALRWLTKQPAESSPRASSPPQMRLNALRPGPDSGDPNPMNRPPESLSHGQVSLRRWRPDDAAALLAAVIESQDDLRPWMSWADRYDQDKAAEFLATCQEQWASGSAFVYAIIVGDQIAGGAGLHNRVGDGGLEIGYWVHSDWTGRGIATAAAAALTTAALALPGIQRVEIYHDAANAASGRIPAKLGYTRLGDQPARNLWPPAPSESGTDVIWQFTQ